jgi:hypothetical protein
MRTNLPRAGAQTLVTLLAVSGLAWLAGCASQPHAPRLSGFLSHYCLVEPVDETTWRFLEPHHVADFDKYRITDVKVLTDYFNGKPLSDETKQKVTDYLRHAIAKAIDDRYPVVTTPGPNVGDIRVAITEAYMTENRLGLTLEGEIIDSTSGFQAAAVVRTELSDPYSSDYWDAPPAREMMHGWASRLRAAIDASHDLAHRH